MDPQNLPLIARVSIGTNDFETAINFYDAVMPTIDVKSLFTAPGIAAYGRSFPEFWVKTPEDGMPADHGNGNCVAFLVETEDQVRDFFEAAMDAGGTDEAAPGTLPIYGPAYFGCVILDPDGNRIEAMFWDPDKAQD